MMRTAFCWFAAASMLLFLAGAVMAQMGPTPDAKPWVQAP